MLEVSVASGAHTGKEAMMPRAMQAFDEDTLPICCQAEAVPRRASLLQAHLTGRKVQILERVGISLPRSVFSRGHLYVAATAAVIVYRPTSTLLTSGLP